MARRAAAVLAVAVLIVACRRGSARDDSGRPPDHSPRPPDESPLGRARAAFGPDMAVGETDLSCGSAKVFVAAPDPPPPDSDGFSAVLVTDAAILRGADAVRSCYQAGVHDAPTLARLCGLFLSSSQRVADESDRTREYIRGHEKITSPVIEGNRLTYWQVRGAMGPEASKVTVDLDSFAIVPE